MAAEEPAAAAAPAGWGPGGRPWGCALLWLALLAPLFFITYGYANATTLARNGVGVGVVVFEWERAIPFWAWTIVPYWSIDAFYGLSFFLCRERRELDTHGFRLLTAQVVCIAGFLLVPLRFVTARPDSDGVFGWMFDALMGFDQPFNQAPSLHICLLVVLWVLYARHVPTRWQWALHAWAALIGLSVLTTYQHHFLDLPTGLAAGALCVWLWPDDRASPLVALLRPTRDGQRWKLASFYLLGAVACAALAWWLRGAALWLAWPALSLLLVALAYAAVGADAFQKRRDGRLSVAVWLLFAPYLLGAWINSRLWTRRAPRPVAVVDGVWLGRVPSSADELARNGIGAVVDLSAELPGMAPLRAAVSAETSAGAVTGAERYRCVPVLDLTVPVPTALAEAADAIEAARRDGRRVLVCCALGYSRSAAAVAAWLLRYGGAESLDAAVAAVRRARPKVVLKPAHLAALRALERPSLATDAAAVIPSNNPASATP